MSAGRFPPHVTLAGSLPLAVGERELLGAVTAVARQHAAFPVVNSGPTLLWGSVLAFDVHADDHGQPNTALVDVADAVTQAVRPLVGSADHLPPDLRDRDDWHGHLSLASHDVLGRPDLLEEIATFVRELGHPYPARFEASRLGVYRLLHRDWAGDWWTDFTWEHVQSITLGPDTRP